MNREKLFLEKNEYLELMKILQENVFLHRVWIFGSRVNGNAKETSDIDLVIFKASEKQIFNLKEKCENSYLQCTVDILCYEKIPDDFKENIKKQYEVLQEEKENAKAYFETNFKETEIGKVPADWEVKEIGEIGKVKSGGTPSTKNEEFWNGEISWITPRDLSNYNFKYISKGKRNITKIGLENSSAVLLPKNSIIFSTRAPIGYIKIAKDQLSTNQGFKNIIVKNENDFDFIFYILENNKEKIESLAEGSVFREFTGTQMKNFQISLPPTLSEQKNISKILSDLDEKIELNKKQNEILEEIGKTIFKRWFIDFEFPDGEVPTRSTKSYMSLPYNPELKERAKKLRKAGNLSEILFWQEIKKGKLQGLDFDRQKIIGNYIVDFFCATLGLVIEIDGSSHDKKVEYDKKRDNFLKSLHLVVIHIRDNQVKNNIKQVLDNVQCLIKERKKHKEKEENTPQKETIPPLHGGYKTNGGKMTYNEALEKEIPEGWKVGKIGDESLTNFIRPKLKEFRNEKIYLATADIKNTEIRNLKTKIKFNKRPSRANMEPIKNSVWFARMKESRKLLFFDKYKKFDLENYILSTGFCGLECLDNSLYYVWFFIQSLEFNKQKNNLASGAVQVAINNESIKKINLLIPSKKVLEKFNFQAEIISKQIYSNELENQKLQALRDYLLPKLIKGTIRTT